MVAYFQEASAVKGKVEISYDWMGTSWLFASEDNRELFIASTQDYAPQYGGYCAYAMAQGSIAKSDARAWSIIDERLYLNLSKDIRKIWKKKAKRLFIKKADKAWTRLINQ